MRIHQMLISIGHYILMFNWITRNSKENEPELVTTILPVAYVIYGIQLNHQNCPSIEYKFSEPKFFFNALCICAPWIVEDSLYDLIHSS